ADPEIVGLARAHGMERRAQPYGDLGRRMDVVLTDELSRAERVCLIGSDTPTISRAQLTAAFDAVAASEVVIGPAVDGGYWLIGARQPVPELFRDIAFGASGVLAET